MTRDVEAYLTNVEAYFTCLKIALGFVSRNPVGSQYAVLTAMHQHKNKLAQQNSSLISHKRAVAALGTAVQFRKISTMKKVSIPTSIQNSTLWKGTILLNPNRNGTTVATHAIKTTCTRSHQILSTAHRLLDDTFGGR
jgi:hypothetical protein